MLITLLWVFFHGFAHGVTFEDIFPGARAAGVGQAYTALGDDTFSLFYNPAALADRDHLEVSFDLGRSFSPSPVTSPLSLGAWTYSRPVPVRPGANFSASWMWLRQGEVADRDSFHFSWAQPFVIPQLQGYLQKPIKVGGSFKILSVRRPSGSDVGIGLDGGVLLEAENNLRFGFSFLGLDTGNLGLQTPFVSWGLSYPYRFLSLNADLRIRKGLTVVYPGIEATLLEGLLQLRFGKGMPIGGVGGVAFGLGLRILPWIVDYAVTLPIEGLHQNGGSHRISLAYRFGEAPFYTRFVGRASERAESLRKEISQLEKHKETLQEGIREASINQRLAQEDFRRLELRLEDLKLQEKRLLRELGRPKPPSPPASKSLIIKKAVSPKTLQWPRSHRVAAGETLRSLAQRYYGDANLWEKIYKANRGSIERGLPQVGSDLVIPDPR